MIQTTTPDNVVVVNGYNGEGYRTSKSVDGIVTNYLYEYDKVVLETDGSNNQKARNVYGTNLICRTVDGQTVYYLYNGHADVVALVDNTGTIVGTYYYDAFGNIVEQTGTVDNNITYAGYQYDKETGKYYLNARMYDPVTARFMQEDTYRGDKNDPLSLNLYTYCHNEPLMYWDYNGHSDVMLKYITEKNGGTVSYDEKTGMASVKIGKILRQYKGEIINGRMIVDSTKFASDFGIKKTEKVTHQAGDLFESDDDAAVAWGLAYNEKSIKDNKEYASSIYIEEKNGKNSYVFTKPNIGSETKSSSSSQPWFHTRVAMIHSHAAYDPSLHDDTHSTPYGDGNDNFSYKPKENKGDVVVYQKEQVNGYVVTPGGFLRKYIFSKDKNKVGSVKTITNKMYFDMNHQWKAGFLDLSE